MQIWSSHLVSRSAHKPAVLICLCCLHVSAQAAIIDMGDVIINIVPPEGGENTSLDIATDVSTLTGGSRTITGAGENQAYRRALIGANSTAFQGELIISNEATATFTDEIQVGTTFPAGSANPGGDGIVHVLGGGVLVINGPGDFPGIQIARTANDTVGEVIVEGSGSQLSITGTRAFINVGRNGNGSFEVLDNADATIHSTDPVVRDFAGATIQIAQNASNPLNRGDVLVSGPGSTLTLTSVTGTSEIRVGRSNVGTLTVNGGGNVAVDIGADGRVLVAQQDSGVGSVTVDGATSTLNAGALLLLGREFDTPTRVIGTDSGTATVTVLNGASIMASEIVIGSTSSVLGNGNLVGNVQNLGGTIAPGLSPGILSITGDLESVGGTFDFEVDGIAPGVFDFDQILVGGNVDIMNAVLNIGFTGVLPEIGDTFAFISSSGTLASNFDEVNLIGAHGIFDLQSSGNRLTFIARNDFSQVAEPATLLLLGLGLAGLGVRRRLHHTVAGCAL